LINSFVIQTRRHTHTRVQKDVTMKHHAVRHKHAAVPSYNYDKSAEMQEQV